ncbi:carbamoyltransferase C-terminal domain-containing protein [Micromonospora aurantiaca]|uniref:carbamoyltransferase family protein n=1 Tax=Micromonospora aurantiaca (nom. illeg.) TaxID=47850 RepID=UPI0033AF6B76
MIVLGISGLPHAQDYLARTTPGLTPEDERICQGLDSAAAIVVDGKLVAAASEERFNGDKGTGRLPVNAIAYCLQAAGIGPSDVQAIAHGFNYDRVKRAFVRSPEYFNEVLTGRTVIDALTGAGWADVSFRFQPVEHHRAHAASAYFPSGFESALCVVADGMGETESLSVYRGSGTQLEKLYSQSISSSLGLLYSICTRFLGFQFNSDEYKVMGLAAYGDPTRYRAVFEKLAHFDPASGGIKVNWPRGCLSDAERGYPQARSYLRSLTFTPRPPDGQVHQEEADLAAALQARLTELLVELVGYWLDETGESNLCLAGGTFLNCKSNQSIAELPAVRQMFVQPAAGDDGTSIGAALEVANKHGDRYVGPLAGFDPYTGPSYTAQEIRQELEARGSGAGISWKYLGLGEEYFAAAADDLARDQIIGWFHGRMEFGPRALGNRSILGLPRGERIKERINELVKFREPFRPFAPAVLEEDCHTLFETRALAPTSYMLCTARVREEHRESVSGVVHADGSARIQVVRRDLNEAFWTLLSHVKERTGTGCAVNTSFNVKGQPLIMSPGTAIDTFNRTSLTRLYIEGFIVWKTSLSL